MSQLQNIANKGSAAVQRLRRQKLSDGFTFMIYSKELPSNQCYIEYPDGLIQIVTISDNSRDLAIIRSLSSVENKRIRDKYNLY